MRKMTHSKPHSKGVSAMGRLGLVALLALGLVGCGSSPTATASKAKAPATPVYNRVQEPAASGGSDDIMKNPFVNWVKRTYPREAAGIINHYLSTYGMGTNDPATEVERAKLRMQVLDTVVAELEKNLKPNMPKGLTVQRIGKTLRCSGVVDHDGHNIGVSFDFAVYLDREGMAWIDQPDESVKGEVVGFDPLARLFGGDIRKKTREEIIRQLNIEGPKNAAKTPGLGYVGAGVFKLNPGVAFVAMPG
ncbi:hypothetical protein D3C87_1059350 [compost metagenome]